MARPERISMVQQGLAVGTDDGINPYYLRVGYITPTKHLMPNFTSLVSLTQVSI